MNLIRQSASGYLNKECDPNEIVEAIRVISLGKRYITPQVSDLLAQQLNRKTAAGPAHPCDGMDRRPPSDRGRP